MKKIKKHLKEIKKLAHKLEKENPNLFLSLEYITNEKARLTWKITKSQTTFI